MGRVLQTKFPNLNNRVLRKHTKKAKSVGGRLVEHPKKTDRSKNKKAPKKRKISGIDDEDFCLSGPSKLSRLSLEESPEPINVDQAPFLSESDESKKIDIVINNIYAEKLGDTDCIVLKIQDDSCDLFHDDELRNSTMNLNHKDLYFHIIDEICLEGLDGITIEALWKRLLIVLDKLPSINRSVKDHIWKIITRMNGHLSFYELPVPRMELKVHNRFHYYNWDIGVVMELAYELPDIYPHKSVNHPKILGSCSTFDEREDISEIAVKMSLEDIQEKYGNKLAVVASQSLRTHALTGDQSDPQIEIPLIAYCILERIGRSRRLGEATQGNMSLSSSFNMDAKSVFHYRKQLNRDGLISKQFFCIKSAITEQNKSGKLLHLERFYTFLKSKYFHLADSAINILKKQPSYRMEVSELKKNFPHDLSSFNKMFKSLEFRRYVRTDCMYPYRFMYPDATKSEYMRKSGMGEKGVRCCELKNPHVNISATWNVEQEDSDDEEDEAVEEEVTGSRSFNMEIYKEVYHRIYLTGSEGCTLAELNRMLGVGKNTVRMGVKKLAVKGVVDLEKFDRGRQRTIIYRARCIRKPEQAFDSKPFSLSSSTASSNLKAKMMEKQRAALLKIKQTESESRETVPKQVETLESQTFPQLIQIETPRIPNCHFLIQHFSDQPVSFPMEIQLNLTFPRTQINLTYRRFPIPSEGIGIDINILIDAILPSMTSEMPFRVNIGDLYRPKAKMDPIMKVVLLKALFEEISLKELLEVETAQPQEPRQIALPKPKYVTPLLEFMGDHPVRVHLEEEKNVTVEILMSTPPATGFRPDSYPNLDDDSQRVAARTLMVIDVVRRRKVFEETHKLLRMIQDEETRSGYEKKMDRKSLSRILKRVVSEGYIKIYKIHLYDSVISKTLLFLCHPSVSHEDEIIQSACQQIKWKYFIGGARKSTHTNVPSVMKQVQEKMKEQKSPFSDADVMSSIEQMRKLEKLKVTDVQKRYNKNAGKTYGVKPKFIRVRILHEFLFYVVYEHERGRKPVPKKEVEGMFKRHGIEISPEELVNLPSVYCKEISWKMFIPPLPRHKRWSEGWALMCDVILRLPVSVFCKITNCPYNCPEMLEALRHPVRRFYLVKDLPEAVRTVALFKRRYLFSIHETVTRMAYCGLLQFGPQKQKEKDQLFVYLNRRASLLDTTKSKPSYNKIEKGVDYPVMTFCFNSQTDLDKYWFNLYGISMNTKLNTRTQGELVVLTDISGNPELLESMKCRSCEEAIALDNGEIPGDKSGAAGLDSALWTHLKRNWFWANRVPTSSEDGSMGLQKERIDQVYEKEVAYKNLVLDCANKIYLHKPEDEKKLLKKTIEREKKQSKLKPLRPLRPTKSIKSLTRQIPVRESLDRKQYYDLVDRKILTKIGHNRRVRWSREEDKVLLLAKTADLLLQDNKYKKQFVPYGALRDVLHMVLPQSKSKTSRAVQRRIKILMKECAIPISDVYMKLLQIPAIYKYYSILVDRIWKGNNGEGIFRFTEHQISNVFVILMSYVLRHQDEVLDVLKGSAVGVDHLSEENLRYTERNLVDIEKTPQKFQEAVDEDGIKKDVLKTIIHSSVVCSDGTSTGLQLLKVYQKYPDYLIRAAVEELKKSNTITYNRFSKKKDKLWQGPYHLSQLYIFYQFTTHNMTTGLEAYRTFLALRPGSETRGYLDFSDEGVLQKRYGQMLGMNEFFTICDRISLRFDLPQNMIVLNAALPHRDELIDELALRYQLKIKKAQQENKDQEQESESDIVAYRQKPNSGGASDTDSACPPPLASSSAEREETHADALEADDDLATIERLRTWVSDRVADERDQRSPSPEFDARGGGETEESVGGGGEEEGGSDGDGKRLVTGDRVLTLDEIKEEMLKTAIPNEDRLVPYITELSDLLNDKEYNSETGSDERRLKRLKKHFVAQYAQLEDVIVEDGDRLWAERPVMAFLEDAVAAGRIWEKIQCDFLIEVVPLPEVNQLMIERGGRQEDVDLMTELVNFVSSQGILGATGHQLKDRFSDRTTKTFSLLDMVEMLVEQGIFLQAGICMIRFVHCRHRDMWLIDTQETDDREDKSSAHEENSEEQNHIDDVQKEQRRFLKMHISPWHKVTGKLNKEFFKTWLCCILSYCLDCPGISFDKLSEKFCYLRRVDIFYLLMILQDIGCVELMCYDYEDHYIFTSWEETKIRRATILDDFEDITITTTNVSVTCLGKFFYHEQVSELPTTE